MAPNAWEHEGEPMAYVGRDPTCGHIIFVAVDMPGHAAVQRETATEVAALIRRGMTVERMACSVVRAQARDQWCTNQCPQRHLRRGRRRSSRAAAGGER